MMDNYWELWPRDILGYALRSTTKDYYWELHALEIADHTCEEIAIWPMDILWGQMVILGSSHWEVLWTANAANHGQLADAEENAAGELVAANHGQRAEAEETASGELVAVDAGKLAAADETVHGNLAAGKLAAADETVHGYLAAADNRKLVAAYSQS